MAPEVKISCQHCKSIVEFFIGSQKHAGAKTLPWLENSKKLREATEACSMCLKIWESLFIPSVQLATERFPDLQEDDVFPLSLEIRDLWKETSLSCGILEVSMDVLEHAFTYTSQASLSISVGNNYMTHPQTWIFGESSYEQKISTIQAWLDCCAVEHPECQPSVGQLPKRLIEVDQRHGMRLVNSEDLQVYGKIQYATLSHSWGGALTVKTTKENEGIYYQELPEYLMPPTFLDAINIVRQLKLRYLWIDALCIVQDDLEEWEIEAYKLKDVYAGSALTIAASSSVDSLGGCFPRESISIQQLQNLPNSASNEISSVDSQRPYDLFDFGQLSGELGSVWVRYQSGNARRLLAKSHLSTRGWALQEQVLSHRLVHCLGSEMQWHCRRMRKREDGMDLSDIVLDSSRGPLRDDSLWCRWAEDYGKRDFTFASDRLPAITGISSYYEQITADTGMLGVWRRFFAKHLLWMRIGQRNDRIGDAMKHLPSWTWLKCSGEKLVFDPWGSSEPSNDLTDHVALIHWDIAWKGLAYTSQFYSCKLVVEGPVANMRLRVAPEAVSFTPPYLLVDDEETDFSRHPIPWKCAGQLDDPHSPSFNGKEYSCLLIRSRVSHGSNGSWHRETFLVLEPAIEQDVNGYRRVGIANMRGDKPQFTSARRIQLQLF